MMRIILAVVAILCICNVAYGFVYTSAECVGDSIEVQVRLDYAAYYGVAGLNLEWTMVGECGARVPVPGVPTRVAATNDEQLLVLRVPAPVRDRILRYYTVFTDANGNRVAAADPGCSWFSDYATCGEGMAFRARLYDFGAGLYIDFCGSQCWLPCSSSSLALSRVEPTWHSFVNTGRYVNVYGEPGTAEHPPCSMPGAPYLTVTRMEFETDPTGCNAVPEEVRSWGAVKGLYR